ncbi:Uncharacterized protein OBRU01_20789 [Operophtera brumata]|uniref:Uncharacterized protein n=1 Tax=Operophtera brumata TaxID=104452 RepID=A0A0L7KUF2_OPEBR|nr:Uncharacterized protein OBRU01_20789 [Operophtera brumata]
MATPIKVKESRWIGGIYDQSSPGWRWGGELRRMRYQSFSKMKEMTPEELRFHCIAMMPDLHEDNDHMVNDVTSSPVLNPKSFDLQNNRTPQKRGQNLNRSKPKNYNQKANELRKRPRPMNSRLTRPFPGRNENLLRSGRTGLTAQQIKAHLARLQRVRDKQIARRRRMRDRDDWLVNEPKQALAQTHARTYTINNNISALHPKTIVEEFDMLPQPLAVRAVPSAG